MMSRNSDGGGVDGLGTTLIQQDGERGYYAVVPKQPLDKQISVVDLLINFAFDTLGARHLDIRICAAES
jgi:hypothetical protein